VQVSLAEFVLALVESVRAAAAAEGVVLRELALSAPLDPGPQRSRCPLQATEPGSVLSLDELRRRLRRMDCMVTLDRAGLVRARRERIARLEIRVRLF
jgi:hypothetical protein